LSKYIDLSRRITPDLPTHPYDSPLSLIRDKTLERDGYVNTRLEGGMHSGTHLDVPMHLIRDGRYTADWDLNRFAGKGCLLDVREEESIAYRESYDSRIGEGDFVILLTGWSRHWEREEYFSGHPLVTEELADFFIDRKIGLLGMDQPSPDAYPFPVHKKLFARDIPILENLTNLESLLGRDDFEILAFPLKIEAEGSPVRAVARIKDDL